MPLNPITKTYVMALRRTIKSSAPRLIEAIQNTKELQRWCTESASIEPSEQGKFFISEEMKGVFIHLNPQELWKIEWNNPKYLSNSEVVIEFKKKGKWETIVFVRHQKIKSKKEYGEVYEMWLSFLDSLQNYLEKGRFEYDD